MKKAMVGEGSSHTALANSIMQIPSDSSLLIHPESFRRFGIQLEKLLNVSLPPFTKYFFAAVILHGIKNDVTLTHENALKEVISSIFLIRMLFFHVFYFYLFIYLFIFFIENTPSG